MTARLLIGDVFERMAELEDDSVDLIITSPPFLALRSYLPDGDPKKAKEIGSEPTPADYLDVLLRWTAECRRVLAPHGSLAVELGDTYAGSGGAGGDYDPDGMRAGQPKFRQTASWGDGKWSSDAQASRSSGSGRGPGWPLAKSLVGVPQLYMLSLAYGRNILTGTESPAGMWRVRNVKSWIRTNPPVGALGDKERPATSYVIVACTSANRYFDLDAVRTPYAPITLKNKARSTTQGPKMEESYGGRMESCHLTHAGAPPRDWWHQVDAIIDAEIDRRAGKPTNNHYDHYDRPGLRPDTGSRGDDGDKMRHEGGTAIGARGVHIRRALEAAGILTTLEALDISPRGYSGAHYAVFPKELVRLLVDEMAPRRVCTECGEPSRRIVGEAEYIDRLGRSDTPPPEIKRGAAIAAGTYHKGDRNVSWSSSRSAPTLGWSDCGCEHCICDGHGHRGGAGRCTFCDCNLNNHWRHGVVLDPFVGSGTTLEVCTPGFDCIGIDIDPRSADLARQRVGMFLEVDEPEVST